MQSARQLSPGTAVILLTAYGSVPDAVSAMRDGALDYLTKPISFEQLQATAAQVMRRAKQTAPAIEMPAAVEMASVGDIVGRSPLLLRAIQRARSAASTGADVLIEAESGTGKELLARFIHDTSDRRNKPFVALNCAAVPEALLASCLATGAVRLPAQSRRRRASLNWRMAARSYLTRSARCLCICSRSCCARYRNANLRDWASRGLSTSTFA
jgi:DNA-binding NtrC family response regulator